MLGERQARIWMDGTPQSCGSKDQGARGREDVRFAIAERDIFIPLLNVSYLYSLHIETPIVRCVLCFAAHRERAETRKRERESAKRKYVCDRMEAHGAGWKAAVMLPVAVRRRTPAVLCCAPSPPSSTTHANNKNSQKKTCSTQQVDARICRFVRPMLLATTKTHDHSNKTPAQVQSVSRSVGQSGPASLLVRY